VRSGAPAGPRHFRVWRAHATEDMAPERDRDGIAQRQAHLRSHRTARRQGDAPAGRVVAQDGVVRKSFGRARRRNVRVVAAVPGFVATLQWQRAELAGPAGTDVDGARAVTRQPVVPRRADDPVAQPDRLPGSVRTGGTCTASSTGGPSGAGPGPAAETAVSTTPPMTPAAIPAAPPASDRMLGRRMGLLVVGISARVRAQPERL
jgi:hypothetical protein